MSKEMFFAKLANQPQEPREFPEVIELNVGGHIFQTTLTTLTKDPNTMLAAMFSGRHPQPQDKDGRYFIDADGDTFVYILRYLRHRELPPKDKVEEVYRAAQYFGLKDMLVELDVMPPIVLKKIRACFLKSYQCINQTITAIVDEAVKLSSTKAVLSPKLHMVIGVQKPMKKQYRLAQKCVVPRSWKNSIIVPIPKKPGAQVLNDFRPVALTSVIAKCIAIVRQALVVLRTLAGSDKVKVAMVKQGETDLVVPAIVKHANNAAIAEGSCGVSAALTLCNPAFSDKVMEVHGHEAIIQALKIHSKEVAVQFPEVIELNVGGRIFQTTLMTLTKDPNTMLAAMFSGRHPQPQDKDGRYFIDADGDTFVYILRYLRHRELPPKDKVEEVYGAAQYFGLKDMLVELDVMPPIVLKKIRAGFLANYQCINQTITAIVDEAVKLSSTKAVLSPKLHMVIGVQKPMKKQNSNSNRCHHCAYSGLPEFAKGGSLWDKVRADLVVGPILKFDPIAERHFPDIVVKEMLSRGYVVQNRRVGNCNVSYEHRPGKETKILPDRGCGGIMFQILLAWQ